MKKGMLQNRKSRSERICRMSTTFSLPRFGCVKISYQEKSYQLRMEQLTIKNIAKILNLVPDTILLVSVDGTVAFPDEHGRFSDIDDVGSDEWAVEGSETSKRQSGSLTTTPGHSGGAGTGNLGSQKKWKPSIFPARGTGGGASNSSGSGSSKTLPVCLHCWHCWLQLHAMYH